MIDVVVFVFVALVFSGSMVEPRDSDPGRGGCQSRVFEAKLTMPNRGLHGVV